MEDDVVVKAMVKLTAAEVVDKLLEYAGNTPVPVGGASDPWRQSGFKKFKFTAKDFLGQRAYSAQVPTVEPDEQTSAISAEPKASRPTIKIKIPPKAETPSFKHDLTTRFKWHPQKDDKTSG